MAGVYVAACKIPFYRADKMIPDRFQFRYVGLDDLVLIHLFVHGRRYQDGRLGSEYDARQYVVAYPVRQLAYDVSGGRRYQNEPGLVRDLCMYGIPFFRSANISVMTLLRDRV